MFIVILIWGFMCLFFVFLGPRVNKGSVDLVEVFGSLPVRRRGDVDMAGRIYCFRGVLSFG